MREYGCTQRDIIAALDRSAGGLCFDVLVSRVQRPRAAVRSSVYLLRELGEVEISETTCRSPLTTRTEPRRCDLAGLLVTRIVPGQSARTGNEAPRNAAISTASI